MWNPFNRQQKRETATHSSGVEVRANVVCSNRTNALEVAAFYHALDLRSNTFARAIAQIERYNPKTGNWEADIKNLTDSQHYRHLMYLMQVRPNRRMTASQMWKRLSVIRDLEGCSAIYMMRDGHDVYELIPCNNVTYDSVNDVYYLSSREYNQSWSSVKSRDVIVLKGLCTERRPLGESLADVCRRDLTLSLTSNDLITKTYAKGGTFRAIVKQETAADPMADLTALNDEEVQKNTETIQQKWDKGDDFIYDPSAANITPVSQSFQDLQLDMSGTKSIEQIARTCGIPLPLMFCSTNAVYKSIDDAWHTFLHLTEDPMWAEVCEEFAAKYFGEELWGVVRLHFNTTNVCLDSESVKAQTASTRKNAGITTANEERAYMGLPAVEGGDELQKTSSQGNNTTSSEEGGKQ